jgi:hypothetical protein
MYEKVAHEHLDGVLAVDPTTLGYVLGAEGPAVTSGGQELTADNVVSLTERDEYAMFPDNATRKAFVVSVLKATANKMTSSPGNAVALVTAASRAASELRLLMWSADPQVESVLLQTNYAGAIPATDEPFAAPILNNTSAGKLDYYLTRSMTYQRRGCGAQRDVEVSLTLTNTAPSGLPPYVETRLDQAPPGAQPGDYSLLLDYFATRGALLQAITINGRASTAAVLQDFGHPVIRFPLEMTRGVPQTIVINLLEPAGSGPPRIWQQPGVSAMDLTVQDQSC